MPTQGISETITWFSAEDRLPEFEPRATYVECLVKYGSIPFAGERHVTCMDWSYNPYAKTVRGREPRWQWRGRLAPWKVLYWAYMPTGKGL